MVYVLCIPQKEMKKPLASVIMPACNAEGFILKALESILGQREQLIEVIVVDDNSRDRSSDLVQRIEDERVRFIRNKGRGIASAMNTGLVDARGDVIMRCDADDLYPAGRIDRQLAWLEEHPEYDGICGAFSTIDSTGNLIMLMQRGNSRDRYNS